MLNQPYIYTWAQGGPFMRVLDANCQMIAPQRWYPSGYLKIERLDYKAGRSYPRGLQQRLPWGKWGTVRRHAGRPGM